LFKNTILIITTVVISFSSFAWSAQYEIRDTTLLVKNVTQYSEYDIPYSGDVTVILYQKPTYTYPYNFNFGSNFKGFFIPGNDENMKSILAIILAAQLNDRNIQFSFDSDETWSGSSGKYYRIISVSIF
jgi:hypothetical protein